MIQKSIVVNDDVYIAAKSAAAGKGQNLMTPDKKTGRPSWVEDAIKEKLGRENE